jgi:hypothetical protein
MPSCFCFILEKSRSSRLGVLMYNMGVGKMQLEKKLRRSDDNDNNKALCEFNLFALSRSLL